MGFLFTLPDNNNSSAASLTLLVILKLKDGFEISSGILTPSRVLGFAPIFLSISAWSVFLAILFKMVSSISKGFNLLVIAAIWFAFFVAATLSVIIVLTFLPLIVLVIVSLGTLIFLTSFNSFLSAVISSAFETILTIFSSASLRITLISFVLICVVAVSLTF